ncbi:MAG: outer membrane lipoprotein LolB [Pseudomonadales bacterium]|nr:outer membrane lipoprotein LolB [Pseudomonadales bacterium]RLU03409.1 MAG: outer membrane lipoprotein LolB [Ketobacter sp.]
MPNSRLLTTLAITLASLVITGCQIWQTTHDMPPPKADQPKLDWVEHVRALTLMQEWQIRGKIGVRTAEDGGSAYLDWSQSFDSFYIMLSGPLGQGSTIVSGNPYGARLETSDGTFISDSPEQLVLEHTGWHIPIHQLLYWVKGIPAPYGKSEPSYNEYGTLKTLQQNQWYLEFDRYGEAMGTLLPQKIKITKEDLKVTLIIKEWLPLPSQEEAEPSS